MAEIVISIAEKVVELLVVPIKKHICYPFKCQSNVEGLKKQVEKLKDVREMVQHSVDEAKKQGDEIEKVVAKWLNNVDEFTQGVVKTIIDDEDNAKKLCLIGLCPNLMVLYSLSKKALKTTEDVVDLLGEGKFEKVSYRPPLQKTTSFYSRGCVDFDSREPIFNNLMETLRTADVNLIGVHGMGGVVQFCASTVLCWIAYCNCNNCKCIEKKKLFDWKDALDQLRRSNPRRIKGMDVNVYSAIKLSYDLLENKEAKSLFLLCSLYDASFNISLMDLFKYCMGICLFPDVSTMEQGRNRLHTLLNYLKASSLLLDAYTNEGVKMHDIVHVVAVSIASTNKFMFNIQTVVGLKEILEEKLSKDAIAVSLPYRDICELPERLELPKLNYSSYFFCLRMI
ncbi:hypothetical protein Ddye_015264 [Dipteronia dyeriana]|uniref:Uncharacterized protein n=1 Tax=Dipteronia dyeriana TaxID=168575 RepID=A0AAD9WZD8_9ROSI|nr:hypothetical protein Ddye_015264 [Dipteronia dyeriana]